MEMYKKENFDSKSTNPKEELGTRKVPLHCLPCKPIMEMALGMMEGGRKYGTHNYRVMGVRSSTYYNATMRHLMAWWEGEDIDPDSGINHIVKALTSLLVLRDSMLMGNCEDDRPVKYPNGINIPELNEQASEIIDKYPECKKPFIKKDQK